MGITMRIRGSKSDNKKAANYPAQRRRGAPSRAQMTYSWKIPKSVRKRHRNQQPVIAQNAKHVREGL